MSTDPFASTPDKTDQGGDAFGQPSGGGGAYPKPIDLFGCLLLLEPGEITAQPSKFNKNPDGSPVMVDRAEATTHVVDGPDDAAEYVGETFDSMYWSQGPIVSAVKKAKAKGQKMILGRLRRFPLAEDKKMGKYQTAEDVEAALAKARPGETVRFAWALDQYDEADAAMARAFLAGAK